MASGRCAVRDWHPGRCRRIGIYGGTFDPVHYGHLVAATEVWSTLRLDRLVFMRRPAAAQARSRHLGVHTACACSNCDRGRAHFALSALDLAPIAPPTRRSPRPIRAAWCGARPFFVMGEDFLARLPALVSPERVAALAELAVVTRRMCRSMSKGSSALSPPWPAHPLRHHPPLTSRPTICARASRRSPDRLPGYRQKWRRISPRRGCIEDE